MGGRELGERMANQFVPNERLLKARKRRGWSQSRLVKEMFDVAEGMGWPIPDGLNLNLISKWERGENEPMPYYVLLLCVVFGTSSDALGLRGAVDPSKW